MPERLRLVRHPRAVEVARRRAALLAALRAHLDGRGFVEADVPALLPYAGQEAHLRPPRVEVPGLPGPLFLQTSPELCLKRLVCAGLERVYALGPAYRGGREELSDAHQPQFSMLEWYRPGARVDDLVADAGDLVDAAADALDAPRPPRGGVLTVADAVARHARLDLDPLLDGEAPAFARAARAAGLPRCRDDDPPDALLGRVFVERVEPALARARELVFLTHYPAFAAALARLDPDDPRVALRVEAYLGGVELANGYVELADPAEHRRRWDAERARRDDAPAPQDEGLLADLADPGLPACVGMALGVDRLHAALLGARRLDAVLTFFLARA